ncbi:MAG: hypothetical protein ACRELB_06875, partial [Polyangiaceae bacterium]
MSFRSVVAAFFAAAFVSVVVVGCGASSDSTGEPSATSTEAVSADGGTFCAPVMCMTGHHWSSDYCECLPNCVDNVFCRRGSHWDPETCACAKNCVDTVQCM